MKHSPTIPDAATNLGVTSDLATTVPHEVGHSTVMTRLGVPMKHISIRPKDDEWEGLVPACQCSGALAPQAIGQIAAAGPLAEGRKLTFPTGEPGGYSDEALLFRAATEEATESGRSVEACWQDMVAGAQEVLDETTESRKVVADRICGWFDKKKPAKQRFDEEGNRLSSPAACRHGDPAGSDKGAF